METKRYIGNDTTRIFARIRRELGPDAVILSTRTLQRQGASPLVEIIAAPPELQPAETLPLGLQQVLIEEALARVETGRGVTVGDLEDLAASTSHLPPPTSHLQPPTFDEAPAPEPLARRPRTHLQPPTSHPQPPTSHLPPPVSAALFAAAPPGADLHTGIICWLESRQPAYPPEETTAIITIQGPEGAGRTTALLKMALDCAEAGRPAALIAADTARAGAQAAIHACAEALNLPDFAAFTPGQLVRAVSRLPRGACLFVDTPAGPWSPPPIPGAGHYAYLAIPAHWQSSALERALAPFQPGNFAGAVFTGTDLAPDLSAALAALVGTGLGLAFLSSSRDVSRGIVPAEPAAIADAVVGQPELAATA